MNCYLKNTDYLTKPKMRLKKTRKTKQIKLSDLYK